MKKVLGISLLILTVGLLPIFLNFGRWGYYDFINQQLPFIIETKRMLGSGAPWWSWNTFFGENFIGGYSFYTATSPFVWVAVTFPYKALLWGILLALYLKTLCAAAFSYLYFKKLRLGESLSVTGGILYAFSSFYICNLFYFHFAEPILLFPLLLIALEDVLHREKYGYICLSAIVFFITFINYYFAFSSLLVGLLYFLFKGWGERRLTVMMTLKAVGSVLIGILMASFILFPVIANVMGSARAMAGRGAEVLEGEGLGSVVKIAAKMLARMQAFVSPSVSEGRSADSLTEAFQWSSIEGFITVFGLLPAFIYAIRKRDWLAWLLVTLIVIFFTPLNGVFYLFTSLSYGRWLYAPVLLLILASLLVVKERIRISHTALFWYALLSVVIIGLNVMVSYFVAERGGGTFMLDNKRWIDVALWLVNLLCLGIWIYNREKRSLLLIMVAVCSTLNFVAFSDNALIEDREKEVEGPMLTYLSPSNYSDAPANYAYRTDNITGYSNIGMVQNTPGITSSHSVFNKKMMPFRSLVGENILSPTLEYNKGERVGMAALMSVKEIRDFHQDSESREEYEGYLYSRQPGKLYDLWQFKYYIPIGFAYDTFVTEKAVERLYENGSAPGYAALLLQNMAIGEGAESLKILLKEGIINQDVDLDSIVARRREFTAYDFSGDTRGFTCRTDFPESKVLFFSVPADKGFTAYVNGKKTEIYDVNFGMSAIVVPGGKCYIRFTYFPPGMKAGIAVSASALIIFIAMVGYKKRRLPKMKE